MPDQITAGAMQKLEKTVFAVDGWPLPALNLPVTTQFKMAEKESPPSSGGLSGYLVLALRLGYFLGNLSGSDDEDYQGNHQNGADNHYRPEQ